MARAGSSVYRSPAMGQRAPAAQARARAARSYPSARRPTVLAPAAREALRLAAAIAAAQYRPSIARSQQQTFVRDSGNRRDERLSPDGAIVARLSTTKRTKSMKI